MHCQYLQRITVPTNGLKDTKCWDPIICTTANQATAAAKQLHAGHPTAKPKKLASTVTPQENNWSPLQKRAASTCLYSETNIQLWWSRLVWAMHLGGLRNRALMDNLRGCKAEKLHAEMLNSVSLDLLCLILHFVYFARGVLWLVHYDSAVSALWHNKYIATA